MLQIILNIRKELKASSDEKTLNSFHRYFKEEVKVYGVKTAAVGQIANKYRSELNNLDKKELFSICEELLKSDITEEAFIVSYWLPKFSKLFEPSDLKIFESWIDKYINNWAKCDGFCNHTIGDMIRMYPELISDLKKWAKSHNRWMKRASAVSLIVPARKGNSWMTFLKLLVFY